MNDQRLATAFFAGLLLLLAPSAPAAARSLHWSAMEVEARLDADGRLHVSERQAMVFTGDWNGGERVFELGPSQAIDLHGVTRIDPVTGERRELAEGDLDRVDRFDWVDRKTLRWRSRLPDDPPFEDTEITYLLEYTLSGVLRRQGDVYRLDHDFAFAARPGPIERFVLAFELDEVWRPAGALDRYLELVDLRIGSGVVVSGDLEYLGAGRPRDALAPAAPPLRLGAFAAALAAMAWLGLRFRRHEASRGRYEEVEAPRELDRDWLEENLFDLGPEEVGALWDGSIGPPEVAAVLARLVAEGKLASSVREDKGFWRRKRVLELELLVERRELRDYERTLIDRLFFSDRTKTDTEAVRKHYEKRGFDPTGVIRKPIEKRLRERLGRNPRRLSAKVPWRLFGAFVALMALEGVTRGAGVWVLVAFLALAAPIPLLAGSLFVQPYRRWVRGLEPAPLVFALPALALAAICWGAISPELHGIQVPHLYPGLFGVLALAVFPVWVASAWLQAASTRDSKEVVEKRYRLAAIRRAFADELERPEPDLEDAWFPYLLAFGLDSEVDRWFASFGGAAVADRRHQRVTLGSSGSSGGSSPGWTGGGGAYGGAGASAGWATAAAGLAAGVARPSSGSGGGSSGGGGSFSGGGGGGGW